MLFCQWLMAVSVSIAVLFYTVGLTLTCDADDDTTVLYLIRTADNKLYTGITTDVERRYQRRKAAKGRKHCAGKEN